MHETIVNIPNFNFKFLIVIWFTKGSINSCVNQNNTSQISNTHRRSTYFKVNKLLIDRFWGVCVYISCVFIFVFPNFWFCFLFNCFLKRKVEKRYKVGWVDRWEGYWDWGMENSNQNILYEIFFSKMYFLCIVFSCMSTIECNEILVFIYYYLNSFHLFYSPNEVRRSSFSWLLSPCLSNQSFLLCRFCSKKGRSPIVVTKAWLIKVK